MVSRRGAQVGANQKPQLGFFFTAVLAAGVGFVETVALSWALAEGAAGAALASALGAGTAAAIDALGCGASIVARGAALGAGAGPLALGSEPA